jgi:hypothetical protein
LGLPKSGHVISIVCERVQGLPLSYLGKGTVVPEVALVGEAVSHKPEFALLDVLLDGVEGLLFGNLV